MGRQAVTVFAIWRSCYDVRSGKDDTNQYRSCGFEPCVRLPEHFHTRETVTLRHPLGKNRKLHSDTAVRLRRVRIRSGLAPPDRSPT